MCTSDPNMTEHTFEEGRTKTNIRVEGRARTLYLGGKKPAEDSGTHLGSREDGDNRVKKMEGTPTGPRHECDMGGGDTRAKQDHGGRGGKDDGETGQRETGRETRGG